MSVLAETIKEGAREMGIVITEKQVRQFEEYYSLIIERNKSLNLTAITGEREVAVKHFLDSLTCLKAVPLEDGTSLMDVGTGAGFPGIPLKICRPSVRVKLVESAEKKAVFLREAIGRLGLEMAEAIWARAEDVGKDPDHREKYGCVVARAVAELAVLAEYCLPAAGVGGCFLAMKGPKAEEEAVRAKDAIKILGGRLEEIINLKLPFTGDRRSLVVIRKIGETPEKYPRRPGVPQKRPL
ncbi:MAG: 16S rRNA (guanine(527)-N(7))-methyltransferase RsmG [Pelotomaculum sp.]|uniref:Ribosomal RNA small subunit methyltransferase G n=1 Tax=Pelotomaculum thermopropionicum (strain DSM 13744 / JCM 10971 / SI) TaxID=370438 RepID=RSMG_PELTS|nr:RecName: Full=Ribosomal RNA small subunit methyltransferase G; AltName: Full=16S rRNA 7-methylguanosine methyltransferase; Short=16S rRNA m7G methyltransferase [Pelotomaculum thermopropionicum SI]NPV74600.1 16S rRNA (guanine(527)-N(7))-methyltransferase RsmG [Pelotomaculum sp.]BAF61096.1 predicted S-adenosylmethionine-dependent methyltransferase [Pelotomaculum thermopropionicum SI]